ncbi:TonB-dependent receptor [Pseudoxanthomonas sp.]|jgi:Outer membrane cobalamin receptor protein|uniref:TonB-dependent receptor plug domain-containing protein n=1 Tax=Pseudoxanthomonas sp. TaxID=1871049 RepID=UPI002FDF81FE
MPARRRSFKPTHLATAILLGLAIPGVVLAQEEASPASGARTLDTVTVTGSRIKRTDVEAALPITIIQKAEIEAQGITSAEQLLQFLNIASNGSDSLASNAGIAPADLRGNNGVSGANLRGQGADATLVLLNGRRVATHGLRGQAVDLNSIPFAAIDRVEVLRDGASAVYGTDAIGGVINFITRSDYRGITVNAGFDMTQEGGGNVFTYSILGGAGDLDADRWNVWGTLNYRENEILLGTDRDFSNTFQLDRGLSPDTRGTPFATVSNIAGGMITGTLVNPAGGPNQALVNILNLPGGPGCEAGGDMMGPYAYQLWGVANSRYACAWDYPAAQVMQQPQESLQALGRATFKISDNHRIYAEVMGSRTESNRQFEAQQITSSATVAATTLDPSTWYPLNDYTRDTYNMVYNALASYFGPANLVYGNRIAYRWRCEVCGPRQIETTTKAYRLLAGVEGSLGSWDYDVGISRASSESESVLGSGYYFTPAFKAVLGSGLLNPFLMPGQSQRPEGVAALQAASAAGVRLYGGESTVTTLDAAFSGGLGFNLWGGEVMAAVGIDLRREEFEFGSVQDGIILDNRYIFGAPFDAANNMPKVQRDVKAVYTEAFLPIVDSLELSLAVRRDDYDGFGATINPKYSFKWQPIDALAFRGAYSTGFKVPEFTKLFSGVTESPYTGFDLADPARCPGGAANPAVPGCEAIQPDILTGGKADLKPEESEQKSFGLVFAPTDNFNVSLDWWEIERTNTIRTPNQATLIANYDLFTANWIRNGAGEVIAIDRRFINSGGTLISGVEIDANLRGELAGGTWRVNLNGSYIDSFQEKALETSPYGKNLVGKYVRYYSLPLKWKHTLGFSWAKGDWAHTLTQIYRDGYKDELPVSVANGSYIPENWNPDVDEYITYNYSVSWTGLENAKFTFVMRNVLNEDPPFTAHQNDFASGAAWEPRVADPRGRSFALMVEYKFD